MTAPKCPGLAAGAVSLRKSHDIVILSFCNIVKGQANSPGIMKPTKLNILTTAYDSNLKIEN